MAKYFYSDHKDAENKKIYTAEKVKENTKVKTVGGEILVTTGNYIFTDEDGNKFGVAEADVKALYTKVDTKAS